MQVVTLSAPFASLNEQQQQQQQPLQPQPQPPQQPQQPQQQHKGLPPTPPTTKDGARKASSVHTDASPTRGRRAIINQTHIRWYLDRVGKLERYRRQICARHPTTKHSYHRHRRHHHHHHRACWRALERDHDAVHPTPPLSLHAVCCLGLVVQTRWR